MLLVGRSVINMALSWIVILSFIVVCRATTYDTIIVGLGSAGSTAASTLAQAGKNVLALEAQPRIGGRVHTVPFGDGIVELGAEWIHGSVDSRTYELAVKNNVTLIFDEYGGLAYRSDGTPMDHVMVDEIVEYALSPPEILPRDPQPFGLFATERIKNHIKEKYPKLANDTEFLDSILNFADLSVDNLESSKSWNDVTTEPGYDYLGGSQLISWHRIGYKTLFEILLNTYKNGPGYPNLDIQLNKEVTQITWPQEPGKDVVVACKDGSTYTAKNVIITVSLGVLKERYNTLFKPPLPQSKVESIQKISMGALTKVVLSFEEAWWPNKTYIAFLWREQDRRSVPVEDSWTTRINGPSFPTGSSNTLTAWCNGQDSELIENLPEEVVKAKLMEVIRRFLGKNMTITEPTGILRSRWYSSPYTRGTYSHDNLQTAQYPNAREELGRPLLDSAGSPKVLFAGEATHPTRFATVHGAADTGFREAMRLISS